MKGARQIAFRVAARAADGRRGVVRVRLVQRLDLRLELRKDLVVIVGIVLRGIRAELGGVFPRAHRVKNTTN